MAIVELAGTDIDRRQQAGAVLFFAVLALAARARRRRGLTSRAVADPLAALRATASPESRRATSSRGCTVDDASEVGLLQAGFNRMTAGLAERERLRDLFGRHVGEDVARAALENEAELGGEEKEVAALFVDVIGSTELAAERPPAEVVKALNRFFAVVVAVTEAHHGFVNKFEGDGALCVFGAPAPMPRPGRRGARRGARASLQAEPPRSRTSRRRSASRQDAQSQATSAPRSGSSTP